MLKKKKFNTNLIYITHKSTILNFNSDIQWNTKKIQFRYELF